MERNRHFFHLSFMTMGIMVFITVVMGILARFMSLQTFQILFYAVSVFMILLIILFLLGFYGIRSILSEPDHLNRMKKKIFSGRLTFKVFIPVLLGISNMIHYKKDEIRRVYIKANNAYVLSRNFKVRPEKMLVILPHCLQSTKCGFRLLNGLDGCRQCSGCCIGEIKELLNRHGIRSRIATGGTAARKTIQDLKPALVIAVACERDLSSGLMDVTGLPVYGILNQRPNGPCKDTLVDPKEIEHAIQRFSDR